MNRSEMTRRVLLLEAAAAECRAHARRMRDDLDADARAELEEQGTAPTWRLADMGTWSLPVSKEAPVVVDGTALTAWVKRRYPGEVMEVVNPPFLGALLLRLTPSGEVVVDPATGEVVPGLAVRPGGIPQTLRFKPSPDARAVADIAAGALVGEILSGLGIEAVPDAT